MERVPTLRRPDDSPPPSQIDTKRLRTCPDPSTSPFSQPLPPTLSMSTPTINLDHCCETPQPDMHTPYANHDGDCTPLSETSDMTRSLQGLCLTASISFNSPRSAGRESTPGEPPKSSPFIYCETDTFGGDKTTRASRANISVFPESPLLPVLPSCKPVTRLPGVKNRLELVLAEREIERLSRELMVDSSTPSESNWSAAKVRFDDDIQVFEYDKPVYDDIASDDNMSGFQPTSDGLENWSNGSLEGSTSSFTEADDCISAPANVAFIPLIPNRRLVGGGGEDIEKRHYDRLKRTRSDSVRSPVFKEDEDGTSLSAGDIITPEQKRAPITISIPLSSSSGSSLATGNMIRTNSDSATSAVADSDMFIGRGRLNSMPQSPSIPTPNYLIPPAFPSPVGTVTVQSPTGVDKLYAESLRPCEDSHEPQTPSARSRKGSMNSNRASVDESGPAAAGDRTSRSTGCSATLGFKSCRSLSPLSRFQTLVTDTIELKSARADGRDEQDNNKRMNSTPAVVV